MLIIQRSYRDGTKSQWVALRQLARAYQRIAVIATRGLCWSRLLRPVSLRVRVWSQSPADLLVLEGEYVIQLAKRDTELRHVAKLALPISKKHIEITAVE